MGNSNAQWQCYDREYRAGGTLDFSSVHFLRIPPWILPSSHTINFLEDWLCPLLCIVEHLYADNHQKSLSFHFCLIKLQTRKSNCLTGHLHLTIPQTPQQVCKYFFKKKRKKESNPSYQLTWSPNTQHQTAQIRHLGSLPSLPQHSWI